MTARGRRAAIIGTVGVPARYGGFETLAEQLVRQAEARGLSDRLTVWCSARQTAEPRPARFHGARLRYLPLQANGAQSIAYDAAALAREGWGPGGADALLLLGVSGAGLLPLVRATTDRRLVVNVDGLEWSRAKWGATARRVLRWSEARAVSAAHEVIADNPGVADWIERRYGRATRIIAYGGDQAFAVPPGDISDLGLPMRYALATARAEPENNLDMVLAAFRNHPDRPALVVLSNWRASRHGREMLDRYGKVPNLYLLPMEHEPSRLRALRDRAVLYVHGHSAGGTNPALVEMMGFGIPVAAFNCIFNRATTAGKAAYFDTPDALGALVDRLAGTPDGAAIGADMRRIAGTAYRWRDIADAYFDLLGL